MQILWIYILYQCYDVLGAYIQRYVWTRMDMYAFVADYQLMQCL